MAEIAFNLNTNSVILAGLSDEDGTVLNAATVEARIEDKDGTQVWPDPGVEVWASVPSLGSGVAVTLDGVSYADGNYREQVPDDTVWTPKSGGSGFLHHFLFVRADDGPNRNGHWKRRIMVAERT